MRIITPGSNVPTRCNHILIHGPQNTGKTRFAVEKGKPICIVLEEKSEVLITRYNPEAVLMIPESMDDYETVLKYLLDPKLKEKGTHIVVDSFSDLTVKIAAWMGFLKMQIQDYGALMSAANRFTGALMSAALPSIVICRSESVDNPHGGKRWVPMGLGKAVAHLPGKLVMNGEARWDETTGYYIDFRPTEEAQRCGVPWLPEVWLTGSNESQMGWGLDLINAFNNPGSLKLSAPEPVAATEPVVNTAPALVGALPEGDL